MKSVRKNLITLATVPVALTVALTVAPPGSAQNADSRTQTGISRPAAQAVVRLGHASAPSVVGSLRQPRAARRTATFQVTYTGFTPAAQAAFQRAVNIWATSVNSTVPITVNASFAPLGTNILGSAGSSRYFANFTGAPRANTFYPDAVANKRAGSQLDPTTPDIVARFSSNFGDWSFSSGAAPAGKVDFTSVVLHELGHGLGFAGAGTVSGGLGSVRFPSDPPLPTAYDRYSENALGKALLSFPDRSTQLANQLKSNKVFFDSPRVRNVNGGKPAKLYAPATWQQGSSYSHLNESTYQQGNGNSLMTPIINYGETIRKPGAITKAIFTNIGW